MTPEEIMNAYQVLSDEVQDYTGQEAAKIGNSQRSLGLMAERVASPSGQTSGLANYTYNRTLRPTVDTLTADLIAQGKGRGLENYLAAKLREARNRYNDAQNAYTVAASSGGSGSGKQGGGGEYKEDSYTSYDGTTKVLSLLKDQNTGYYYNPETGNVVVDGKELNVTPEQHKQAQDAAKKGTVYPKGSNIFEIMKNQKSDNTRVNNNTRVNEKGVIVDKNGNPVVF